jgi:hypothetical protein
MSQYTFIDPETGKEFVVKGAAGLTEQQAFEIYSQQQDTGALINLKPGDILSAVSQAAQGLTSALSQVAQGAAGIAGSVTGAIGGAINQATRAATGLLSATTLSNGLSGALGTAQSVASKTLTGITSAVRNLPVTNGINIANYAKQATGLMPIKNLTPNNITATLSQASKLTNQLPGQLTNTVGLGKYGLDCKQLERAGYVKPGTYGKFLANGSGNLTSVLNSPAVWTGKAGVGDVTKLLSSVPKQDAIQQNLMASGLQSVAQLGIPVDKLNPQQLAGTALNAAKSPSDTLKWASGQLSSATSSITSGITSAVSSVTAGVTSVVNSVKSAFDTVARDAAFAVDFSNSKIDSAMSSEVIPPAINNTVDRKTLNAAVTRIVGNKKIPSVSFEEPIPLTNGLLDSAGATSAISGGTSFVGSAISQSGNSPASSTVNLATQDAALARAEQLKQQAQALDPEVAAAKAIFDANPTPENYDIYRAKLDKRTALYAEANRVLDTI